MTLRKSRYDGYYRRQHMGRADQIARLENQLKKHVAMRDGVPIVAQTNNGNIGIYGAFDGHIISVKPENLSQVINLLTSEEAKDI